MLSQMLIASVIAVLGTMATSARAVPGDGTTFGEQTCSTGCVAGLILTAAVVAICGCCLMCCLIWPAPELITRQEKRAAARKRIRERGEAEEEARAKNEALDDESL